MQTIDQELRAGHGVTIGIWGGGGHAITVWGFNYDAATGDYKGLWVSDSDDDKGVSNPPDRLRYYQVAYDGLDWHLQDYYGSDSWHIGMVSSLDRAPTSLTVSAGRAANNGVADAFTVSTNAHGVAQVVVNGSTVRTVPAAVVKGLTINGSNDRDTVNLALWPASRRFYQYH